MQIRVLAFISIFFVAGAAHAQPAADASAEIAKCGRYRGLRRTLEVLRCRSAARQTVRPRATGQGGARPGRVRIFPRPPSPGWRISEDPCRSRDHSDHGNGARIGQDRARPVHLHPRQRPGMEQIDGDDTNVQDPQPGKR